MTERLSVDECLARIKEYVNNANSFYPFFVSVDGADEYKRIKFETASYNAIRLSSFCYTKDAQPNFDALDAQIEEMAPSKPYCLLGLGDYVALTGSSDVFEKLAQKELPRSKKLVVLCRGISQHFKEAYRTSPKFADRRCFVESKGQIDYTVNNYKSDLELKEAPIPFKTLLEKLEDGAQGTLRVSVPWKINAAEFYNSYYEVVHDEILKSATESLLDADKWKEFYNDPNLSTTDVWSWRFFLNLKTKSSDDIADPYLCYVSDRSDFYDADNDSRSYKNKLIWELLYHDVSENSFDSLYDSRRKILADNVDSLNLRSYITQVNFKPASIRCRFLTDLTDNERDAILQTIAELGRIPDGLEKTAPALAAYLKDYDFQCVNEKSEIFKSYFSAYKRLKLANCVSLPDDSSFLEKVEKYAVDRQYLGLSTRGALVDEWKTDDAELYWLDALGVEYLGFIKSRAQEMKMALEIKVGQATVPTITKANSDFFDSWEEGKRTENHKLDEFLHEHDKDVKASSAYLFRALEIIDDALKAIKKKLDAGDCQAVVLASDHGASRLAALYDAQKPLSQLDGGETIDDGEHCGRCCGAVLGADVPAYVVADGKSWAMANYERFKGSKRRGQEYHGGATLEEVLVPVVRFTLANKEEEKLTVDPVGKTIRVNRQEAPRVPFTVSRASKNYRVFFEGKTYPAVAVKDTLRYEAVIDDFNERRLPSKEYNVDVYDGDKKVATLCYSFEGGMMKVNKKQSDFF